MKTLTSFIVNPALYREVGIEAQPGDQVELYLNQDAVPGFPEFIVGTIQNPVTTVCGGTSYDIEYDEADFSAVEDVEELVPDLVSSVVVVSEARVLFAAEQAAREAADDSLQDQIDECVRFTPQTLSTEEAAIALSNLKLASNGLVKLSRLTDAQTIVASTVLANTGLSATLPIAGLWEVDLQFTLAPTFNVSDDSGGAKIRLNSTDITDSPGLILSGTTSKSSSTPFRTPFGLNYTYELDADTFSSGLNSYNVLIHGIINVDVAGTITLQIAQKIAVAILYIGVGGSFLARYLGNP